VCIRQSKWPLYLSSDYFRDEEKFANKLIKRMASRNSEHRFNPFVRCTVSVQSTEYIEFGKPTRSATTDTKGSLKKDEERWLTKLAVYKEA